MEHTQPETLHLAVRDRLNPRREGACAIGITSSQLREYPASNGGLK